MLAVNTSAVEPLPHQISAVYEHMLDRQPLRFLPADDPGAGKTTMAGLLIKEQMLRGDVERCLIVVPGNLTEQWQDELREKFQLTFQIMTNDKLTAAASRSIPSASNWRARFRRRQAEGKRWVCADHPTAPSCVVAGGDSVVA